MSYTATWNYLRQLTSQARYTDIVKSGHWIWVYDNLNMHQRVRHEREGTLTYGPVPRQPHLTFTIIDRSGGAPPFLCIIVNTNKRGGLRTSLTMVFLAT